MTGNTQAGRQLRFTSVREINEGETALRTCIEEAIEVEKSGKKVTFKKTEEYEVPEELIQTFEKDPQVQKAFENLTPGRQRGYLLYFSTAKQEKTRYARIERYRDQILAGKGIQDS